MSRAKNVETYSTTGPDSEAEARKETDVQDENLSQSAEAEKSLLDNKEPVVVRTVEDTEGSDAKAEGQQEVNSNEGEVIIASNGLPYEGVSADWVRLEPKD